MDEAEAIAAVKSALGLTPTRKGKLANKMAHYSFPPEPRESHYSPYPILGWRTWTLTPATGPMCDLCRAPHKVGDGLVLTGVYGKAWPEAYMRAKCYCGSSARGLPEHKVPEWNALCGIYATKNPPRNIQPQAVIGIVALSDVIEHETGYRAAEARILALTSVSGATLMELRSAYPAIDIARTPERLLRVWDYFSRHPDEIPRVQHPDQDERNQHGPDWKAPAAYTTDAGARDRAYYQAIEAGYLSYDEARRAFPPPITDA